MTVKLDLQNNDLGPNGAKALAASLAKMTALKDLKFTGSNIGGEGKMVLKEAWRNAGKCCLDFT